MIQIALCVSAVNTLLFMFLVCREIIERLVHAAPLLRELHGFDKAEEDLVVVVPTLGNTAYKTTEYGKLAALLTS